MTAEKCYSITVTGKVQDIGLRAIIEYAGRLLDISGLVFNARDGSVRIMCCGNESIIREFFQEIKNRAIQRGAALLDIKKQELPFDIDFPHPFSRVLSDEDIDLGRKLDKGNEFLGELTKNTSEIINITSETMRNTSEIIKNTSELPEIKSMLSSFVVNQDVHNQWMKEHNQRLEKILEKLSEK